MNDRPEEEEDDATTDLLIGEGDDWPEGVQLTASMFL